MRNGLAEPGPAPQRAASFQRKACRRGAREDPGGDMQWQPADPGEEKDDDGNAPARHEAESGAQFQVRSRGRIRARSGRAQRSWQQGADSERYEHCCRGKEVQGRYSRPPASGIIRMARSAMAMMVKVHGRAGNSGKTEPSTT